MSGDGATEQVRKESGGASWRPLFSTSLFVLVLQPCSLEGEIRGLINPENRVQKSGENGEQYLSFKILFGFSVLRVNMNKYLI